MYKTNLEAHAKTWTKGALVFVQKSGPDEAQFIRPAAFVFEASDGALLWVEPGYDDEYGPGSPALHRSTEPAEEIAGAPGSPTIFKGSTPHWSATAFPADEAALNGESGKSLRRFLEGLTADGTTWEAERERVREMIRQELAPDPTLTSSRRADTDT